VGGGEAAEPTTGLVKADLGDVAEEYLGGELKGEGLDAKGIPVTDAVNLKKAEVEPAGGGEGGGIAGEEKDDAKREGRHGDGGEEREGKRKKQQATCHGEVIFNGGPLVYDYVYDHAKRKAFPSTRT